MTPQERQLVEQLFDRLAKLEPEPRDADAERAIREGLTRAPNAIYALVQTAILQDEALRRANDRIEALQAELDGDQPPAEGGGFLDRMRNTMFGADGRRGGGSVPSVGAGPMESRDDRWSGGRPMGVPPGYGESSGAGPAGGGAFGGGYGAGPAAAPAGGGLGGGSFLGTAAAAAAGTIGGSLLLNSIRGMMGPAHASQGSGQSAVDPSAGGAASPSPWGSGGNAANSDLARQAGVDDVGSSGSGQVGALDDGTRSASADRNAGDDPDDADYDDSDLDFGDDGDFDTV
ncbi:MAG: DUF2076 domain-containing protein [Xanthobacteraceae bacterium]